MLDFATTTMAVNPSVIVRELHHLDDVNQNIRIEVSWPRPDEDDWACDFKVSRVDGTVLVEKTAHGIDAMQALLVSLDAVRNFLKLQCSDVKWAGSQIPGDTGIPRMIPGYLPKTYTDNIEMYMDSQVSDFLQKVTPANP